MKSGEINRIHASQEWWSNVGVWQWKWKMKHVRGMLWFISRIWECYWGWRYRTVELTKEKRRQNCHLPYSVAHKVLSQVDGWRADAWRRVGAGVHLNKATHGWDSSPIRASHRKPVSHIPPHLWLLTIIASFACKRKKKLSKLKL